MLTISDSWRRQKCATKKKHLKKYDIDEDRLKNRPKYILEEVFKYLINYWNESYVQVWNKINLLQCIYAHELTFYIQDIANMNLKNHQKKY